MKKDIPELKVESVAVAVVPQDEAGVKGIETVWDVFLLNMNNYPLEYVIITAKGYGELEGENRKTSTLRYLIETLPANSYARIEPLMENVLGLNNEYWVSFFHSGQLYDKRYIFLPETISRQNLTSVPLMETRGVLII